MRPPRAFYEPLAPRIPVTCITSPPPGLPGIGRCNANDSSYHFG